MTSAPNKPLLSLLLVAAMAVALPLTAGDELPLRFLANAGNQDGGQTTLFEITINKWTPENERQVLMHALRSEGSRAMRASLQNEDSKGKIAPRAQLGVDLRYAYKVEHEGGTTIVLAADRPIDVEEAIDQDIVGRSYNTTVVVLELDEEGKGAGRLMLGAEVAFDEDGELEFTNVVPNPVVLGNVRITGRS